MKHNGFLWHVCRVVFIATLLVPGWQVMNAGDAKVESKDVLLPWKVEGVRSGRCGWEDNKTIAYYGLNNTGEVSDYANEHQVWGKVIERGKDGKNSKVMVYIPLYHSRTLPPYAREDMYWQYYFCGGGDKTDKQLLYHPKDSLHAVDEKWNNHTETSSKESEEYGPYTFEEFEDVGDYDSIKTFQTIIFDNSTYATPRTIKNWLLMVCAMHGDGKDGHSKVGLRTDAYQYNLYYPEFNGSGTKESPLQISSGALLRKFATIVNSGAEGTNKLCAVLTADIDYTSYTDADAMIGKSYSYRGTFDGQGHSIRLALDVNDYYVGLFGSVAYATIKNLELTGTVKGQSYVSSLVASVYSTCTFENVLSRVEVTGTSTSANVGGFFAYGSPYASSDVVKFTNCAFTGNFAGNVSGQTIGGFGYSPYTNINLNLENCYIALPSSITCKNGGTFSYNITNVSTTNCYYTNAINGSSKGTQVTDAQMQSGEICWRLNGSKNDGTPWLQTLKVDSMPCLWGSLHVYEQNGAYFNFQPSFRGAGTKLDPFQIENVEQLEKFRDIVNAGYYTLCAKLVADIDLANRNWIPIGLSKEETYLGTFDGNGYMISNLSIDGYELGVEMCGFFGCLGKDATVKNMVLKNVTVKCNNHAGTIAARSGGTTMLNCGVFGVVSLSCGSVGDRNGLAYAVDGSTLTSCYTVFSNLSQETRTMTATRCYCGNDVKTKHASGELTFLLNDGDPSPWVQTLGRDEYPLLRGAKRVSSEGGVYVNPEYVTSGETGYIETTSGKDFRVIHHGGRLYEFIITMGTQDGAGQYICPAAEVSYSNGGTWTPIFTMSDVNADSLDFSEDWWGKINIKQGVVYDTKTYDRQVPTFWIRQGNHTTCKQTSLLWVAPENLSIQPSNFQLNGTANNSQLNITATTETTTLPDDASGLTVTDPMIAPTCEIGGSQMVIVVSTNGSYGLGLWDATDNHFISTCEYPQGTTSIQAYLPPVERNHDVVALLYTRYTESDMSGNSDTTYVNYAYPFLQKPTHSILRDNTVPDYSVSNLFQWAIAYPNDTDVINSDQFVLARAYQSDYSDLVTKSTYGLMDTAYCTTEKDTIFGWFQFTDTLYVDHASLQPSTETHSIFDTWNIPQTAKDILCAYQYPAQYLYYQAYRPSIVSIWNDHSTFLRQWKVLQREVLPIVDSVRIIKDADFKTNHKITVRIVMNNPYPWDMVSSTDRNAVWEEAIQQQFTRRMFTWDKSASIQMYRFSNETEFDQGTDVIRKTISISGDQVKQDPNTGAYYVEYQDIVSMPFVHYNYKAKVNTDNTYYPICEALNMYAFSTEAPYTEEFGGINNLQATRGSITGSVEITWEADETTNTTLGLRRREYERGYESEKELADWTTIDATNGSAYDDLASAAVVNEYILTITTKYRDIVYSESDTTYGYAAYYGSLNGRVKMSNGVNMPGDVHVVVNSEEPFALHEVKSPKGEVILTACQFDSIKKTLSTDENGNYQLDSVPYYGTGRIYTVYATCEGATFVSPTGSASTIDLTYEDANYDYSNIDFTCNDTKHFSGRILYTNSTVPVRDVMFKVNGTILRDANGDAIVTDATGNFSFNVPRMEVTIQAFRPGHKISNDGYILGGESGDQKKFTPTHDYAGLVIDDDTRVRLVGRVAGGIIQGAKPLGFGAGKNNLGDSITLVLTLEGDHTSYLYFDKKNPDKLTDSQTFTQAATGMTYKQQRIPTQATFEAKRIVVKADNETGEFCLDLFPTKYVVSQIYAEGYSTLYSAGEGLTVLDLTDSVGLHTHYNGEEWTEYDGSFRKIYHAPVQVDLLQLRDNKYQTVYGAKSLEISMLSGVQTMQMSWIDSTETAQYALGHPLYEGGKSYHFMVSAYEPYYYNNVSTGSYDRVPMAGYEVSVHNGLTSQSDDDEDEDEEKELTLSPAGTAMFSLTPNNSNFSINSDYDGLRYLSASVDINSYHYESEPVAAFVTGSRDYQVEVVDALEGDPQILDYIRDPYGSGSFAYRTAGTTYNWSRSYSYKKAHSLDIELTAGLAIYSGWSFGFGAETAATTEYMVEIPAALNVPTVNTTTYKNGEFSLELSDQLSTSDDPMDQGAIADVYVGAVSTADVVKYQTINVVDSLTYRALLPAIETGVARLVAEGKNEQGRPTYLVICGGVSWQPGTERVFAYSQRHILNTLIPQLEARRAEALHLAGSMNEAVAMAAASGKTAYYMDNDGLYVPIYPSTMKVKKDTVAMLTDQIEAWQDVIATNERIKYEAMKKEADMKYSVAGVTIEHSEEASTYYRVTEVDGPLTVTGSLGTGTDQGTADSPGDSATNAFKGLGLRIGFGINYNWDNEKEDEYGNYSSVTGGSGYTIVAADNSYFDMDVYYQNDSSVLMVNEDFMDAINGYESGRGTDKYANTSSNKLEMTDDNTYVHNYIFVMRGGASREPWIDADSTQCYFPDGENSVPLGTRTLKIDKPVLYVENPVINNLPQDEKAVFILHLSNETELDANVQDLGSSVFLHVVDATNPYGAKFSIDGEPLHGSMEFSLDPGQSITKTLEVERGSAPYDYDDIVLELSDGVYAQVSSAPISIHYLPTSTPVTLTQPAQNFLINTLSQVDEDGKYYIPVQIEGFSTTKYDNFHHIELQYKRKTDSEDQWVNLCSYYADELLYKVATGNKAMIETEGKISDIRFYGEQDPVEQEYDLRAVSFCRLGNGYTTRMSSVISGTKDTRCPEVFGLPKPVDGILSFDDVISLPFTEPIAYNYLDETANFTVQGYTNNSDVDNSVALYFTGSDNQQAASTVDRVLNAMDFSVEMNVKVDSEDPDSMVFIAINDDFSELATNTFMFGYNHKRNALAATMNGQIFRSKPLATYGLTLTSAMTHVGMTYSIADSTIHFFVGEQEVDVADDYKDIPAVCHANGVVNIGTKLHGKMNNIRLWSKALNLYEMTSKYKKRLSSNEANLLDYWPADEASGTIVKDIANGATLTLTDVSWSLPDGYSVNLDHQTMHILSDQALKYTRNKKEDYTISFYFKADALDDDANLFAAGSDALEETGMDKVRIRFIDGVLYFISEGQSVAFGNGNNFASDATWHYLAVSVNHAQNKASLFIDGALVNQLDASNVGGVAGSEIVYGDEAMACHIDQVQMWSMALPASYIKSYYNADLTGKEKELQIYLPFEREEMNSQGTMFTTFSAFNHVIPTGMSEIAGDTVIDETLVTADNKVISPVRSSTGIENLPFTWKSTDNELQITINKSNSEINNQNINLVVRRVEDLNGNPMQNAQMWTTYVNRNVLTWVIDPRSVVMPYGTDTTIVAAFRNSSGRELNFTLDCTSPYITLGHTMGTIAPLGTMATTISISDGLAPGVYQAIINLTDEDNLCSPLPVLIHVSATAPDWQATTDPDYNQSMDMIAQVKKLNQGKWTLDMSKQDMVAAFIGKECVGVANLTVDAEANTSRLYMTIRGKTSLQGQPVEFRLWEHLTGKTYILKATPEVAFAASTIVGTDTPVELKAEEMRVQTLALNAGWNWISFFVDPFADKDLNQLFSYQKELTEGDIFRTPFGSTFASYQSNDTWDATLDTMSIRKNNVYHLYAHHAANVEVSGSLYNDPTITLNFSQSEWAEMAYLNDQSMPVRQVLGDFVAGSEKAPAGTVIKAYNAFAIATAEGTWEGSLQYLRPGEGYFVRRNGLRDSITITFTNVSASAPARQMVHSTSSNGKYATMMPLVATFADGDMQEGDMLLAMVGKEVVAVSEATDALFFVSLHANQGEQIQFAKVRHGEVVAVTSRALKYDAEGQAGTVEQPYLIDFTEADPNAPIYDILGMKYEHLRTLGTRVMIQGTKKVLNK